MHLISNDIFHKYNYIYTQKTCFTPVEIWLLWDQPGNREFGVHSSENATGLVVGSIPPGCFRYVVNRSYVRKGWDVADGVYPNWCPLSHGGCLKKLKIKDIQWIEKKDVKYVTLDILCNNDLE